MKTVLPIEHFTDEYVLSEIKKLKYTYGLNRIIRYNLNRVEHHQTQSVAEHVCNMIFLAHYFRDLEDPDNGMDFEKVIRIIIMHDMGEIETGDIILVAKTEADTELEKQAIQKVKVQSPDFIQRQIEELFEEFENPITFEGKFVKAIDKLEGQIFWVEKAGVEMAKDINNKAGFDINMVYPIMMTKVYEMLKEFNFKYIERFMEVIDQEKVKNGIMDIPIK